ncbi:M15 family metallopeptidase [Candidatus Clostridium stratigraminis]|uniref:D-alanyl-D-alanine dipeptidase n=1 Tax=Candidatus Clostridium stratigraminis TaxID=3381661 RepID=A0ABW8T7H5_9CLOT
MKIIRFFIIFLYLISIFTGCSMVEKPVKNNDPDSAIVKPKPSIVEKPAVKQQEITKSINENPEFMDIIKQSYSAYASDEPVKEIGGFVLLSSLDKDIVIDLKYATTDNFTKRVIYPNSVCVLKKNTAEKLVKANTQLEKLGYRIKVWDAYRPIYVQQIFWNIVKDSRFVANPKTGGSIHNKGCAVDITLVGKDGKELTMPSKFDDFSTNAYRTNSKISIEAKKNMNLLTKYMVDSGFTTINTEWWHFDDSDSKKYKAADINLEQFKN